MLPITAKDTSKHASKEQTYDETSRVDLHLGSRVCLRSRARRNSHYNRDQFCINSRRKEIKEDDNEEAYEEKAPFLSLV